MIMNTHADLKPSLIDLEADNTATGGKQEYNSVQPERLNKTDNMYFVYWISLKESDNLFKDGYIGITSNLKDRFKAHNKKRRKNNHFKNAIQKYGWKNLIKTILHKDLSLEKALEYEEFYRPKEDIGWNSLKGGILGNRKEWYNIPINKLKHSINTSIKTKEGILKEEKGIRSIRAKLSYIKNKNSYIDLNLGSKNPKARLTEKEVYNIRFNLIPEGLSDNEICKIFNVKNYVIYFIRINKTWKHVICDSPDYK